MNIKKLLLGTIAVVTAIAIAPCSTRKVEAEVETIKEYENLYYGYNVTGGKNLMEHDALQIGNPIIDPNSNYSSYIVKKTGNTEETGTEYSGANLSDVSEQYASSVSAGVYGKIYTVNADIATLFDKSKKVENAYSEFYEIYTTYIYRYTYQVQGLEIHEIKNFLSLKFKNDIESVNNLDSAKNFFSKYGTHLNTGYIMGGRLNVTNYRSTKDTSVNYSTTKSLEEKMGVSVKAVEAGNSVSITEQNEAFENTSTSSSSYRFKAYGGTPISALTVDDLFTYNASLVDGNNAGFMYTRWINSIGEDKDLTIVGIPQSAISIPLWNLLDNTIANVAKRQYLIDAYIELCGDNYDSYLKSYPDLERTNVTNPSGSLEGTPSEVVGAYIRTPNDYFYQVDADDFKSTGDHYGVHKGDFIYFDINDYTSFENISYDTFGCEQLDSSNSKTKIFKVTSSTGQCSIKMYYDSSKESSSIIFNVPILKSKFEGGMGNEKYPYIIASKTHFMNISSDTTAHYQLFADIDFGNTAITSLGDFSGVLDGNYCTLSNFTINSSKKWGLFNSNSGTIKNLKIKNAGTSVNSTDFEAGGVNYREDYDKDTYEKNSIKSVDAGVVCGNNSGTISNCYLENVYVRNIIKNDLSYLVSSEIKVSTGGLVGTNSGVIENCGVYDSRILGSFICGEKEAHYTSVNSGGLVGSQLGSGKIQSCVVDLGTTGSVFSQTVNNIKGLISDSFGYTFAATIAGYSESGSTYTNNYAYRRSDNSCVDISYDYSGFLAASPKAYFGLRGNFTIANVNGNVNFINNYSYFAGNDTYFPNGPITISTTNGNNSISASNSKSYKIYETSGVDKLEIKSEVEFNKSKLNTPYFKFDNSSSAFPSKVTHMMKSNRSSYLSAKVDTSKSSPKNTFYSGEYYTMLGLNVKRYIGDEIEEDAKIYKLTLTNGVGYNIINNPLIDVGTGTYSLNVSLYSNEIKASNAGAITIKENELSKIFVDDLDEEGYSIYYDEIEKYFSNLNLNSILLKGVLTNGEVVNISEGEYSLKNAVFKVITVKEQICMGKNLIEVTYSNGTISKTTEYVLNVKERNIESIKIINLPTNLTYSVGDKISLSGIEVEITYSDGNKYTLKGNEINQLELVGGLVSYGENSYGVMYRDYNLLDYFTVNGIENKYTVDFIDYDGRIISSNSYFRGETVVEPENPIRESDNTYKYVFIGWDKSIEPVTDNVVYKAQYETVFIEYIVEFKDYDGTILSSQTYHYGDTVVVPENPTRESDNTYNYVFIGWDKSVEPVTGNITYEAQYTNQYNEYTIEFKDYDGTVLSSQTYHYGDTVVVPENPTRGASDTHQYTFIGWDKPIATVTGNAIYTAQYEEENIAFKIVFQDYDGTILSSKIYKKGDTIISPSNPTRNADNSCTYVFKGWDKPIAENVTENVVYTAQYNSIYIDYTIEFKNYDGSVISSQTYHYGDVVTVPVTQTKPSNNTYQYVFTGWDKTVTTVTGNTTYIAQYQEKYIEYIVAFQDYDGSVISSQTYHYGDTVIIPENPTRIADSTFTYEFKGWNKQIDTVVTKNTVYEAQYNETYIEYIIVFKNYDGSVISSQIYHYGDIVAIPEDPIINGNDVIEFVGWDKEVTNVNCDMVYTAVFENTNNEKFISLVSSMSKQTDYNKLYTEIKEALELYEKCDKEKEEIISAKAELEDVIKSFDSYVNLANKENVASFTLTTSIIMSIVNIISLGSVVAFIIKKVLGGK